ncbi:MAG: AraC family transcriptional regulator [Polyangiales bacterium]
MRAPPGEQYPQTDVHSHHVIQVTLALTGTVTFESDTGRASGVALVVAPDAEHAFAGTGLVAHLFVAPEGPAGRRIAGALCTNGPVTHIPAELLGDLPERLRATFESPKHTDEDLRAVCRDLIARLAQDPQRARRVDARITRLVAWVTPRLQQPVTLDDAAAVVGLSAGRTRHLFVQQTGLPFRTYLLWLRLQRAVELFAAGTPLTEAAHAAGFADSAHLSRTFRRMFGIAAATLRVS